MGSKLSEYGIVKASGKGAAKIFEELSGDLSFNDIDYSLPSDYINYYISKYREYVPTEGISKNNSTNGKIFEYIIETLFVRERITPMYLQATVAFVPNVRYDILTYCKEFGPIAFFLKTSLRERYKQADLEAIALKYVHRKAKCYILTLDAKECHVANNKIKNGDVIGINECILCTSPRFNEFIAELKSYYFELAGKVDIIESKYIVNPKD